MVDAKHFDLKPRCYREDLNERDRHYAVPFFRPSFRPTRYELSNGVGSRRPADEKPANSLTARFPEKSKLRMLASPGVGPGVLSHTRYRGMPSGRIENVIGGTPVDAETMKVA